MAKTNGNTVALHDFYKTNGVEHPPFVTEGASLTRQEFAEECDINSIMSRYDAYLADPMRSVREPMYYDFTQFPDTLLGFMQVMRKGEDAFMTLPAEVRREFDNDPAAFVDFAANPDNLEQMREWGLAEPVKAPEEPLKVQVVYPEGTKVNPVSGLPPEPAKPSEATKPAA